ncbi:MAG: hypothetical protein ABI729_07470 [Chitinophagales bacterium]
MATFDKVLDEVMQLDHDSREMLLEIIRKRQIEDRRDEIAGNSRKARNGLMQRKLKPKSAAAIIKELHKK